MESKVNNLPFSLFLRLRNCDDFYEARVISVSKAQGELGVRLLDTKWR
jgi:hypothetical protein